jgi:hypothetical protein
MRERYNRSFPAHARTPGVLPGMLPSEEIDGGGVTLKETKGIQRQKMGRPENRGASFLWRSEISDQNLNFRAS